nr:SDR family NAD(P)-dependent oxidoreductase [Parvularcula bermudensis]
MMATWGYRGTAVITGAGSGIGRALAFALAEKGMDLALVDIREDRLEELRQALASNQRKVTIYARDVADRDAMRRLPSDVAADHDQVSVLVNNAGVALGGQFDQVAEDDFDWLMNINFRSVVDLTRAFLPHLREAARARIVNTSSLFGIIAPPGQAAYSASKFAVRGFSEALRHELDGSNVGLTVVHPGGIATNIATDARIKIDAPPEEIEKRKQSMNKLLRLSPEKAAKAIVEGVEKHRGRVLIGNDAKAAALVARLFPETYYRLIGMQMKGNDGT